ncbi:MULTISPECIES: catabolic alanine racemase DadX [Photorhabdus]|uniref:Alanine racemase n=2 Tax=Photorhabdus asymbiotica TaxID=291112 RepID=C7BIC5_PHOAA|nr:catabolic alanine racemase DadX [Photorhabdus asymbiotica]RKS66040.1 alanine racemase [Photorhabdus asymbiotica]CAQ84063.1 alanine racemase, catabolic [Photorhabdus asymbiotica]
MPRPISATIHLDALENNLAVIRNKVGNSKIWAVVKANAYGHGLRCIWPHLDQADGFALLDFNEAILLREQGWQRPILLLEGFFQPEDLRIIDEYQLTTVVHSHWQLKAIEAANFSHPINIYLKLNSGMNRLGFPADQYREVLSLAKNIRQIGQITLMSHFANADKKIGVTEQLNVIDSVSQGLNISQCLANSGACLWYPQTHRDWVRTGIALYGASPSGKWEDIADVGLKAVMSLKSEIIAVQNLKAGDKIGYGSKYTAPGPMRVGTVACGYADGYPRCAMTGTPVIVNGVRTQMLGAISMDMMTVDLTPCPQAQIGSPVELWGQNLPVDDVAGVPGTIGYELLCALAERVPVSVCR